MTELERLIQQKKELEEKIKMMRCAAIECKDARFMDTQKRTDYGENIAVSVRVIGGCASGHRAKERWMTIARCGSRKDAIERISEIVCSLEELKGKMMESGKDNNEEIT